MDLIRTRSGRGWKEVASKSLSGRISFFEIILLLPTVLHAQPGFTDDTADAPIDGGLSLLIVSGVGYGVKKMRERRKSRKS